MTVELIGRCYVYRFFDANERLLYVGITSDVGSRFSDHRRTAAWWPDVSSCAVETTTGRAEAEYAEAVAILSERPLHNGVQPSVSGARERVLTNGVDLVRVVAEVEKLRREANEWHVRAVVAEAHNAAFRVRHELMRERLAWAQDDVRHADGLLAEVTARRSHDRAQVASTEPVSVGGDWGDER